MEGISNGYYMYGEHQYVVCLRVLESCGIVWKESVQEVVAYWEYLLRGTEVLGLQTS